MEASKKRKGSLTAASEKVSVAQPERRHSRSTGGDTVATTIRFSREAWREVHDMAISNDLSVQQLVFNALNRERAAQGLPPLKPVPSTRKD